jgi:hypothetical protein
MPRTRNDPPRGSWIDTWLAVSSNLPVDGEVACEGVAGVIEGVALGARRGDADSTDRTGAEVHAPIRATTTIVAHATRANGRRRILETHPTRDPSGTRPRADPRSGRQNVVIVTATVSCTGVGPPDVTVMGQR